ncbi:MAG: hypothetical protein OJF59_000926 [Cytophagales bacterium]|jgi:glycosyltransferase involved in cell wall biosynthesis|nr:glycosyltransferase family 4 protein [Bacteroidota bacterium]MBS1980077.1 glycosyltransferase family 4 protein [Bacteroidota bacterium]WHZ07173.1 MAG: hypothetical protein OJF59_000926 [Cytophagales bacterium]
MLPKKKIIYIISHVHKSLAFEWTAVALKKYYDITFILLNPQHTSLEGFLIENEINVYRINYRGKKDFVAALVKTFRFLLKFKPEVVHAHLLDAQLIGLSSAWVAGIKKRVYTRHNSNFHHVYHRKGIFLDKVSNWLATAIVSISKATDISLTQLEKVDPSKIKKIPHGFNLSVFDSVELIRVTTVRKKWSVPENAICIGVIARHIEWKGIQYIVPAFKKFLRSHPASCLILANASGPYHETIMELTNEIPRQNLILIPFEEDVAALYKLFDIYVHTPIDEICEAFGQTYIEALACGVPSVFTLSGVASEFVVHLQNAWVANYKDEESIFAGMKALTDSAQLRTQLIENGKKSIARFEIKSMTEALQKMYDE